MTTPLPPELREIEARLEADKISLPDSLREQVLAAALAAAAKRALNPRPLQGRFLPFAVAAVALFIALNAACASKHREPMRASQILRTHAQAMRFEQTQQFPQEP